MFATELLIEKKPSRNPPTIYLVLKLASTHFLIILFHAWKMQFVLENIIISAAAACPLNFEGDSRCLFSACNLAFIWTSQETKSSRVSLVGRIHWSPTILKHIVIQKQKKEF